ncbi:MAG: hypothetical protein Q7T92_13050 [Lutibacter sp.]|nr:hypothetical protein [Lutibacter sp.]
MKANQRSPSYDVFRSKMLKFLAVADGATQRASRLVKRGKGGLGGAERKEKSQWLFLAIEPAGALAKIQ